MPPLIDDEETQRLDDDSSSSEDTSNWESSDDESTVPIEGTMAIETERLMDDSILYGETQALDNGIETQVVGVDDGYDDDGIESDETRVLNDLVDSDASTDDEGTPKGNCVSPDLILSGNSCKSNSGSVRSIASVRAASLRSSGLAAAKRINSKEVDVDLKSPFVNGEDCGNQENAEGDQTNGTAHLTVLDTRVGDVDGVHESQSSQKHTHDQHRDENKSRTSNPVVKKLLYELTSAEGETTNKPNSLGRLMDSPGSPSPRNVAGLSYVESQEPGDLSQASALDVVDKFLVVNELELSQDANTGNGADAVKSPPVLSAKGTHLLANKTEHRSPVGKSRTFEWIDSQEDEGGGEFFSRRKDFFFERKDSGRKSRSQPPKSRNAGFGIGQKSENGNEVSNPEKHQKGTSLTRTGSRLRNNSSLITEKAPATAKGTRKNLFEDPNELSNSKHVEQHLELPDVDRSQGGTHEFGPDTQMAAEAMEALVHATPTNNEINGEHFSTRKLTITSGKCATKKTTGSKTAYRKKSTSSTANMKEVSAASKQREMLPDISAASKQREMLPDISKRKTCISSRSNSKGKKRLKCTAEESISKRGRKKLDRNQDAENSVNENESSEYFAGVKALGQVDKSFTKGSNKCSSSLMLNVQPSVSKRLVQGDFQVYSTPVAHRTRQPRAVNISKTDKDAATDLGKDANATLHVSTQRTTAREDKLATDTGCSRTAKRKCSGTGLVQNSVVERDSMNHMEAQNVEGLHADGIKTGSVKSAFTYPKRRRTSYSTPDNPNMRTQKRMITVKNLCKIRDAARKKRSASVHMVSEIDDLTSNDGKAKVVSSMRTRSSTKPTEETSLANNLSRTIVHTTGLTDNDLGNPCSTPQLKQGVDFGCQVEVAEENGKPEDSCLKKLNPSPVTCTTPLKNIDAMSPVCGEQNHHKSRGTKGRSQSLIRRELMRLETSNSSPTSKFNMRQRKDMANVRVLFSRHLDDDIVKQQKKVMGRLGVPLASSISEATHFITDNFVRTRNMLEAMALGKPVVTHMWLESCGQASCFIDEKNYILRDAKKEREIGFSMPVSIAHACQNLLLQGRSVYITPNVKPGREIVSSLVKAAHGQPIERLGRSLMKDGKIPDDLLFLSCEEDYSVCIPLLEKGAEIFSSELLLNGIVIQKLEYDRHRLFLDHVKRTRSTIWLTHEDDNWFRPVTKCT